MQSNDIEPKSLLYPGSKENSGVKVRSVHRRIRVSERMLRRIDFCVWLARKTGTTRTGERRPAGTADGRTRRAREARRAKREKEREERQYGRTTGRQDRRFVMTSKFGQKVGRS